LEGYQVQLDNKTVASLALLDGKADAIFFDNELPGFGLRLRAGGHRTWIAQYRAHGRTRRLTIGAVEKLTLVEARKAARKILAKVELGEDPQGDREAKRRAAVHTLCSVAEAYLEARKRELRPASYRVTKLYLTGAYFKPLHTTAITKITHPDVAARISAIKRASGDVTARQARAALSSMYKWAMGEGLMGVSPFNPVVGTNVPAGPRARERVLSNHELIAVWRALGDDDFGKIIKLLVLSGARRSEIGGMRWSEIDLERGLWCLPGARAKNKRPHVLPLLQMALDILKSVPRWAGRDQLFGTRAEAGFTEWDRAKRKLDAHLGGAVALWKIHDLRRTTATRLADLGVQPHIIEAVLNHQGGHKRGVAGTYNRSPYEREVKAALALWSEHVVALIEDREEKIIPLRA
jgi:integrase